MENCAVPDGDVIANFQWPTVWIIGAGVGDVQHAAVLHTGAVAHLDPVHIAPY